MPCFLGLSYLFEQGQPVKWTLASSAGLIYQGLDYHRFLLFRVDMVAQNIQSKQIGGLLFSHARIGGPIQSPLFRVTR